MIEFIKNIVKKNFLGDLNTIQTNALILAAKQMIEVNNLKHQLNDFSEVEFRVFSQYGEDGIIQYLINKVPIPHKIFIEFGVQKYIESNTRFLLINNYWKGLIIDGTKKDIDFIKKDEIYLKYDLTIENRFINVDNINSLINNFTNIEDVGLLSIDIDGNDYWIWKSINCIKPRIIICEYNSTWGFEHLLTIPYEKDFDRTKVHGTKEYWGASLPALCHLAEERNYKFIGCNSAGNNAFFLRNDLVHYFKTANIAPEKVNKIFNESKFSKDNNILADLDRLKAISTKLVFNLIDNKEYSVKEIFNL